MFLNIYDTISHNCLFMFLLGNRGGGKTFGFKKYAIDDFLKTGAEFAYVRRYRTDLKESGDNSIGTFFDDIREFYPSHNFEVKGLKFYIDGQYAGKAFSLSTAAGKKSVPYPKINKICYDEFLLDPSGSQRYLSNEPEKFLELYKTIARQRPNVRAFFMANAISISNPWFSYFDLNMPHNSKIQKRKNTKLSNKGLVNGVMMQLVQDSEFIEAEKESALYDIIKDKKYAEYAVDNKFLRDDKNFVMKKTPQCEHSFTMRYKGELYGVWTDYENGLMFLSLDVDPFNPFLYAITTDDHRPNTMLIKSKRNVRYIKKFLDNYQLGNVRYESMKIKGVCNEIIKILF